MHRRLRGLPDMPAGVGNKRVGPGDHVTAGFRGVAVEIVGENAAPSIPILGIQVSAITGLQLLDRLNLMEALDTAKARRGRVTGIGVHVCPSDAKRHRSTNVDYSISLIRYTKHREERFRRQRRCCRNPSVERKKSSYSRQPLPSELLVTTSSPPARRVVIYHHRAPRRKTLQHDMTQQHQGSAWNIPVQDRWAYQRLWEGDPELQFDWTPVAYPIALALRGELDYRCCDVQVFAANLSMAGIGGWQARWQCREKSRQVLLPSGCGPARFCRGVGKHG
jgi:hypothetical protein